MHPSRMRTAICQEFPHCYASDLLVTEGLSYKRSIPSLTALLLKFLLLELTMAPKDKAVLVPKSKKTIQICPE